MNEIDDVLESILTGLKEEATKLGADIIQDGIDLVEAKLKGEATDRQLLDWLAARQEATE